MGSNQYWPGRVYNSCVYFMRGTAEGSTESGFMEKPGIELVSLRNIHKVFVSTDKTRLRRRRFYIQRLINLFCC